MNALFRPSLAWWMTCCLAGLAVGLWPDVFWPTGPDFRPPPLPTLRTLALAQGLYFLLIHPLLLLHRRSADLVVEWVELLSLFLAALPILAGAAWLADATWIDAARGQLAVAGLTPVSLLAGRLLHRRRWRGPVLLGMLLLALGLGGVWYLALDFLPPRLHATVRLIWPIGFLQEVSASRLGEFLPRPIWAWLLWPTVGCAVSLGIVLLKPSRRREGTSTPFDEFSERS